jgi:hypothetical protein
MSTIDWVCVPDNLNTKLVRLAYNAFKDARNEEERQKVWSGMVENAITLGVMAKSQAEMIKSMERKIRSQEEKITSQEEDINSLRVFEFERNYYRGTENFDHLMVNSGFEELKKMYEETKTKLETANYRLETSDAIKKRLQEEKDKMNNSMRIMETKNEELHEKLNECKDEKEEILAEIEEQKQALIDLNTAHLVEVAQLKNVIDRYKLRLTKAKKQAETFRDSARIKAVKKSTLANLRIEIAELRATLKELEEERDAFRDAFAVMYNVAKDEPLESKEEEHRASLEKAKSLLGV